MTDFTKEELIYLFEAVDSNIDYYNEPEIAYSARDKLKSMIDNYCEHDYRSMGNHPWLHCIKCKNNFNFTETQI